MTQKKRIQSRDVMVFDFATGAIKKHFEIPAYI